MIFLKKSLNYTKHIEYQSVNWNIAIGALESNMGTKGDYSTVQFYKTEAQLLYIYSNIIWYNMKYNQLKAHLSILNIKI